MKNIQKTDKQVYKALTAEIKRQNEGIEMIPSENYVSKAVLEALGSVFTNKYSEGYPKRRYYGGQENTDTVETLAIERAKTLFGAQHVNVQPLSGAPANLAVYSALLNPGDTVLGMDLSHGGHLTHGHPVTLSAKIYNFVRYKTKENGTIDYEKLEELVQKTKPKILLAGFSSYTRQLNYRKITKIAKKVGAISMMDMAHIAGLVAGKALPNPVPLFDVVTTTTHKSLRGPRGGMIMCKKEFAQKIDKAVFPGLQGGPHMNNITALAIALKEAQEKQFQNYATQVLKNAKELERGLKKRGATLCFGAKTDNHMVLINTMEKWGLTGKQAEETLDAIGITVNKNVLPDDVRGPLDPSGIRVGTPAATTRGMKEKEMTKIAVWIDGALTNSINKKEIARIKKEVRTMCLRFPINKDKK
ncbi:MAG: serine hydroxymethyltransferase [Candidatus Moranbacteria bacterium]|nr:serine hydroxymethyltransferase [Candidatus Moranbacteria bacterium]